VLIVVALHVVPGVRTEELDRISHDHIVQVQRVSPANIGYQGYPKIVLTSVNQVVCHGNPSPNKVLKKGDIVNIDVAVIHDGCRRHQPHVFVGTPEVKIGSAPTAR
jgi:methionyl aminopeptidase